MDVGAQLPAGIGERGITKAFVHYVDELAKELLGSRRRQLHELLEDVPGAEVPRVVLRKALVTARYGVGEILPIENQTIGIDLAVQSVKPGILALQVAQFTPDAFVVIAPRLSAHRAHFSLFQNHHSGSPSGMKAVPPSGPWITTVPEASSNHAVRPRLRLRVNVELWTIESRVQDD
jgi:hypothetical protein